MFKKLYAKTELWREQVANGVFNKTESPNAVYLQDLDGLFTLYQKGAITKEEYELALEMGYQTLFLGKRILRAETAGIALTAIIMHSLKEFE